MRTKILRGSLIENVFSPLRSNVHVNMIFSSRLMASLYLRDGHQISLLILIEFIWINKLLLTLVSITEAATGCVPWKKVLL